MTQYLFRDARGNNVRAVAQIASYAAEARNMLGELKFGRSLPFSVWRHDTVTGVLSYDGARTRRLSDAIVAVRRVQS